MKNQKLNNQTNKTAIQTKIKSVLATDGPVLAAIRATFPQTIAVYAFGSRINATANADSDLDLSVLVAGYANPLRLWELSGDWPT